MAPTQPPGGRRERNKQEKLLRITAAAADLFARHGVDDVTTQQIADAADIGTGTLFLYAKTKGELLLMVQNAHYAEALDRGRAAATGERETLAAVLALLRPVVECNRVQVDNGRTYLREMVFGDPGETHHARALEITAQTEQAVVDVLVLRGAREEEATLLARVVSAVLFLAMASPEHLDNSVDEVVAAVRAPLEVVLGR